MLCTFLLTLGLITEPNFSVDIPVNLSTGTVDIQDQRPYEKNADFPIELRRRYHFRNGRYRCDYLHQTQAWEEEEGAIEVLTLFLPGYEFVKFVKDSEYTYKPYFGQEYAFHENEGSAVNHPENIEVTRVGKYLVVLYLDGKKFVYEKEEKTKFFNLLREKDSKGFVTHYSKDKFGAIDTVIRKAPEGQMLSFATFGSNRVRNTVSMDVYTCADKYTYELKNYGENQHFYASYKNNVQLDKAFYDEGNDYRIRYLEDHQYGRLLFGYDKQGRVSAFIKSFSKGDALYSIRYFDCYTEVVFDNQKTTYHFDEFRRLDKISKSNGYEKRIKYNENSDIEKLEFFDCGRLDYSKSYVFDKSHNIIKLIETIDKKVYETRFEYDARCRKIKEINPMNVIKTYSYLNDSPLLESIKESVGNDIVEVNLYEYDEYKRLVKHVIQDGEGGDFSFCKIKHFEYSNDSKSFEKPSKEYESYIEPSTGAQKRLGGFKYEYRKRNLSTVIRIDDHSRELGKESYFYDEHRRLIRKVNFLNEEELYCYDKIDRLTRKDCGDYREVYKYGIYSAISRVDYFYKDAKIASEVFDVDFQGRLRSKGHSYGNTESFSYDDMNRKNVIDGHKYSYDTINRIISIRSDEQEKSFKYSGLYEPSFESYFDGTYLEKTPLDKSFLSFKYKQRNGKVVFKTFDPLGNLIKEECGEKIFTYKYRGRTLLEKKGPTGFLHKYTYDGANRLIKEEGQVNAVYAYDSLHQMIYKKINNLESKIKYDLLGRKVLEAVGSKSTYFKYDALGNVSQKSFGGQNSIRFENDNFGNTLSTTDLNGLKTQAIYSRNKRETLFPDGKRKIELMDSKKRVVQVEEFDREGVLVNKQQDTFNGKGKCIKRSVDVFKGGVERREIKCEYDPHGSLISEEVIDEVGCFKTCYEYNKHKQLIKKIKPDGVFLSYEYDEYGKVIKLQSSDNSVNYRVEYDLLDREVRSIDYLRGITFTREYDQSGNLLYENFNGSNFINFEYENGQRKRCLFPDKSYVEYQYQHDGELCSIDRFDRNQKYRYSHQYQYNGKGLIWREVHPFNTFTSVYSYNKDQRAVLISNPFQHESISLKDNLVTSLKERDGERKFSYDDQDQLIQEDNHCFSFTPDSHLVYDLCGRVVFDGEIEYSYDALDRVVLAKKVSDGEVERYLYDYYGRLRKKEGKITQVFIYDGDHEIGSIQKKRASTLGIINPKSGKKVAVEFGPLVAIPLYDLFDNVKLLIDSKSKEKVESYSYNSFGGPDDKTKLYFNPWRYKGKRAIAFDSLALFPSRLYNLNHMMFMSKDPLKQALSFSLYQYCFNNPLSFKDEDGLAAEPFNISAFGGNYLSQKIRSRLKRAFFDSNSHKKKMYYVNGLDTSREYLHKTAAYMNQFFTNSITSYYRRCGDSIFGVLDELMGCRSRARNLSVQIQNDIAGGASDIYLFGHSAGGATIDNVISLLNKEEQQKINVTTFGSACLIDPSLVKSATNYYSTRDYYLSLFQFIIRPMDSCSYMSRIPALENGGFMDHSIMGDTYRNKWMEKLTEIQLQ
jgi:RHS repeat-associated protein